MSLPQSIQDMADLFGMPAAMALSRHYGGIGMRVPTGAHEQGKTKQHLIEIMGEAAAMKFIQHYAAERIYVPRLPDATVRKERNREIVAKFDAGKSTSKLAREYCLSVRQIANILKCFSPDAED